MGVDARTPEAPPPVEHRAGRPKVVRNESSAGIGEEFGEPGTYIDDSGRVRPAVGKYGSRKVRGTRADWGLYEEHFRSEPQIYQPVTSISEVLQAATYEVQMPETVKDDQEPWLRKYIDWTESWLKSVEGGLASHVCEAAETIMIYGPAVHEIVWGVSDPDWTARSWKHPVKFGYREPSTIEQWHLTDDESRLAGVEFDRREGGGELMPAGSQLYPRQPRRRPDAKILHTAYHQRGNNFEGVPPTRPSAQFVKLKQLLIQIAGLAADKYGVPIPKVMDAEVDTDAQIGPAGTGSSSDKDDLFSDVKRIRSGQAPVLKLPSGLDLEYEAPPGSIPTLGDLLEYADQQISQCFENQGSLLGQQSAVGSYALGRVSDDKFLRQAPAVARMVLRPIDDLIRWHATQYLEPFLGERIIEYPTVGMRLGAGIDTSAWVADLSSLMGKQPMTRWPDDLQSAALDKLDLPDDALEGGTDTDTEGTRQTDEEEGDDGR